MGDQPVSITSVDSWRARLSSTLTELDISPKGENRFAGRMQALMVGDCPLLTLRGPSLMARHPDDRASKARTDRIVVIWQLAGRASAYQLGERLDIEAGDIAFLHVADPYEVDCFTDFRQVVLSVPAGDSLQRRKPPRRPAKLTPSFTHEPWTSYLKSLASIAANVSQGDRDSHRSTVIETVNCLRRAADQIGQNSRDTFTSQIVASIRDSAADPQLTPDRIARQLAVSRRTLFRQLQASGTTYQQLVIDARLDHARDLLLRFPTESVAAVAQESGFTSRSHFHDRYRARFGETPKQSRASGA